MGGQDLTFYAGDSPNVLVTIYDANNNVINLTGAFLRYVLIQGTAIILTKTTTNGGIALTAPTAGQATIYFSTNDTTGLQGAYEHQLRLIDSAGNSAIVMTGTVTVDVSYA